MKTGIELIADERKRQIENEKFSVNGDFQTYACDELLQAAAVYMSSASSFEIGLMDVVWPWSKEWFKPTTAIRDLEKAGALIAAHIDVLIKLESTKKP